MHPVCNEGSGHFLYALSDGGCRCCPTTDTTVTGTAASDYYNIYKAVKGGQADNTINVETQ